MSDDVMNALFERPNYHSFMSVSYISWETWWGNYDPPNIVDAVLMIVFHMLRDVGYANDE